MNLATNVTDVSEVYTLVIGTATVYTTFAGVALAAFASASKTLRKMVSKYTALAVFLHLLVAGIMLLAQFPLSAELTRLAKNDVDIDDVEARLASAGLTYGSITMLFSVFLVYTPSAKRKVTAAAGGATVRVGKREVRVGFSRDSLREFLAQFLSPHAKRVCMRVYLVVFLLQGLSAWSLQKAVEIYFQSIQAHHLMSEDEIVLLRFFVVVFYIVICQVFLIAFFTPMADVRENDVSWVQRSFTALLALKSGSWSRVMTPSEEPHDEEALLMAAEEALLMAAQTSLSQGVEDMLVKLRVFFASVIIVSQWPSLKGTPCEPLEAIAVIGSDRRKVNAKTYVAIYLSGLCLCSLGCWVYVLWEAGVQIGVLDHLEALRRALVVIAVVVVLLLASVQWVWHACFTIVLLNVLVVTYLFTLPFCSDGATASLESHPVLTWSISALYAFELGALLPLLLVFSVIVSLNVRIETFDVYVTPFTMMRAVCPVACRCLQYCCMCCSGCCDTSKTESDDTTCSSRTMAPAYPGAAPMVQAVVEQRMSRDGGGDGGSADGGGGGHRGSQCGSGGACSGCRGGGDRGGDRGRSGEACGGGRGGGGRCGAGCCGGGRRGGERGKGFNGRFVCRRHGWSNGRRFGGVFW